MFHLELNDSDPYRVPFAPIRGLRVHHQIGLRLRGLCRESVLDGACNTNYVRVPNYLADALSFFYATENIFLRFSLITCKFRSDARQVCNGGPTICALSSELNGNIRSVSSIRFDNSAAFVLQ